MAAEFKVTDITKTVTPPGSGVMGPALEVHFETVPEGVVSSVVIPASMFSEDEARTKIAAQVAVLKAVKNL